MREKKAYQNLPTIIENNANIAAEAAMNVPILERPRRPWIG
jgi:hypothetical protein